MKNTYVNSQVKIVFFKDEDVIATSGLEIGVKYDDENWGTGDSWFVDSFADGGKNR